MLRLKRLRETGAKYHKEMVLRKLSDIEILVFQYALDPYKVYHLKNFPVMELDEGEPTLDLFDLLDHILDGTLRGNMAKDAVNRFAAKHGNLIKRICQKNLRCGVNAKTINKVWPDLIPMFEVQLAKEIPLDKLHYPKLVQIKYDGVRLITIKKGNEIKFRTRNGKEVNLPELREVVAKIDNDIILDGEIVTASGKIEDRTKVSGMINSAMHGGSIDEQLLIYQIFDSMSLDHWEKMKCPVIYLHRLKKVRVAVEKMDSYLVETAFTFNAINRASLEKQYNMFITLGYEGLILKSDNHLYSFKRSADWVKIKEIKTVDIKCVGVIEGIGKYKGMIGALECIGTVEDKIVCVNVGSGLTDSDRMLPATAFVNKTIEIKYNTLIYDTNSRAYSLFLPRFVEVRYDK